MQQNQQELMQSFLIGLKLLTVLITLFYCKNCTSMAFAATCGCGLTTSFLDVNNELFFLVPSPTGYTVTSGVPQGSVIGPVLFNLFTSELPNYVKSSLPQYADDTVLYRIIRSANDTVILQNDLDIISKWCTDNRMQLNSNKLCINYACHSIQESDTNNLHVLVTRVTSIGSC